MAENKVFMDTNVFTDIVNEVEGSAYDCKFPDNALNKAGSLNTFNTGRKINAILKGIHRTDEMYRQESSISLPKAFLTMRDSMIAIDKEASESLTVEKVSIGGIDKQ